MSKVLKRLYLRDVVKSFGTKRLRKLTTEKPQEDSIIGTWVFNETLNTDNAPLGSNYFKFVSNNLTFDYLLIMSNLTINGRELYAMGYEFTETQTDGTMGRRVYYFTPRTTDNFVGWTDEAYRTITITEAPSEAFATWLKANATKQESIVGTWRFNETLDLSTDFVEQVSFTMPYYPSEADNTKNYIVVTTYKGNKVLSYSDTGNLNGYVYNEGKTPMWYQYDINGTINITNADNVSGEFITWLKANATKIA